MSYPITRTKIIPPRRHKDLLSRQRLLSMLDDLLEYRLTLMIAPAGYGKTSLLVDLAAQVEYPVCWLSLDPLDHDPLRFLNHFAAAIQQQFPDFGGPSRSLFNNLGGSDLDMEQALRTVINDIYSHIQEHFALILDDFYLIDSSPDINQFINRFTQEMDENCHLVITSRSLLNLPDLPHMIGRSQVHGLSYEELAFHSEEFKELYKVKYQQELSDQDAERIVEETNYKQSKPKESPMNPPYQPVIFTQSGPYHGAALVGTHSAIIGWSFDDPELREGLHGFAIRRTDLDPATGEILRLDWLGGYKQFKETDTGKAEDVRSLEAPFQRFRWSDYTLRNSRSYIYEVFPMRGSPEILTRDEIPLRFELQPSQEDQDGLGVFANRGVTAAKAYLSRFKYQHPSEIGPPAYRWLSRGLKESLLSLINNTSPGESLHVAIYEFFDHEIAKSLKEALDRNVDVHIVHDAKPGKKSTIKNENVITQFGLENIRTKRTTVNISHNKIVIRLVNDIPKVVWTGSANFSENAFNFQTNMALIIRDPATIQFFEDYFQVLIGNPPKAQSKIENRQIMDQANQLSPRFAEKTFFSPIKKKEILETSVELIKSAKSIVMISAPFGVDKTMIDALGNNSEDISEYGLVNSAAKKKIESLNKKNTRFFPPNRMRTFLGRTWDSKAFGGHKIHAKTIVIDPWSDNPKVFIGSANFSKASCNDNDENAILITGDYRLSSIIATEFIRIYDHYKARFYVDKMDKANKKIKAENIILKTTGKQQKKLKEIPRHLESDYSWSRTAFDSGVNSHKYRDRIVFSGG